MDIIAHPGWKVGLCKQFRVYVYLYFINFNVCLYLIVL